MVKSADDLKNALADKVSSALDDAKTDNKINIYKSNRTQTLQKQMCLVNNDISAETPATPETSSDEVTSVIL